MANEGGLKRFVRMAFGTWKQALLGALSFWLPDLGYHYWMRSELSRAAIWKLAVGMPIAVLVMYAAVLFVTGRHHEGRLSTASSMLLGIWVLGPAMIMLSTTFSGGGFKSGLISILTVTLGTALFPVWTFIMAGYDLTLPAVLLVTTLLIGARFTLES
jgi:hypothetical protein